MKKIFKTKIFYFLLGAIIFGTIGVYGATLISSSDVTYNDKTAKQALDELYERMETMYTQAEYDAKTPAYKFLSVANSTSTWTVPKSGTAHFYYSYKSGPSESYAYIKIGSSYVLDVDDLDDHYNSIQHRTASVTEGQVITFRANGNHGGYVGYLSGVVIIV